MKVLSALAALATCIPCHAIERPWWDGGDLSAVGEMEKHGARYHLRDGTLSDAIRSLASFGANCVRLRLFVEPDGKNFVVNDLKTTLALAKRAKDAGQSILLDFHYSDTWADPGAQKIPASWQDHSLKALAEKVENHTYETLRTFAAADLFPALVQIGNEIDNGLLWPVGSIYKEHGAPAEWDAFATLLKHASSGVRRATPEGMRTRIILHLAAGGNAAASAACHSAMKEYGLDYDVAGFSYYPWWHGSLESVKRNAEQIIRITGKEIMVVEAAYPSDRNMRPQNASYEEWAWERSPEGQKAYLHDLIRMVSELPDQKGIGVLWWHPDSIATPGLRVWMGGSCALWQSDGKPLLALEAFSIR